MKQIFKSIILLSLYLVANTAMANIQDTIVVNKCKDFKHTIVKNFPMEDRGTVNLSNRYGDVTIKNWNKPEVEIEVTIIVDARSEDRAASVFDRIDIDFDASSSYVSAVTNIESKSSWTSWFGGGGNDDYKIHYEVYLPEAIDLKLFNKYGNAYVDNIGGNANLEIKYGNLQIGEISGNLDLQLGYGNATIASAGETEMLIKYSKVEIGSTADLHVESKYSHFVINDANDLRLTTKYDHYKIGNIDGLRNTGKYDDIMIKSVRSISATSKYTDYLIGHLIERAEFDLEYGSAKIDLLDGSFKEMDVEGRYTDYRINVEEGTEFKLDAVTRYAGIRYPDNFRVIREKEHGSEREVEGYNGDKNGARVIRARLNYGGIKVKD